MSFTHLIRGRADKYNDELRIKFAYPGFTFEGFQEVEMIMRDSSDTINSCISLLPFNRPKTIINSTAE